MLDLKRMNIHLAYFIRRSATITSALFILLFSQCFTVLLFIMHVCMYNIFLDFKIEMRHMLVTRALWARPLYEPGARSKIRSEDIRRISSALMSFLSFFQTLSVLISPFFIAQNIDQ